MSQKKLAIGIDLGTTKCCVGVVRNGRVEILENERARKTTPAFVAFTDTERLVGEDAKDQAMINPANTVFGIKGIIGRGPEDPQIEKAMIDMPYIIVDNSGDPCINVTYKGEEEILLPQQVTAMLLAKMKGLAESRLGCHVEEAVISVPASFSNGQRQATKDAATIAGLKVLALINEPTASAIAYQTNRKEEGEENIAVVDFGGGKVDVAIVSVSSATVTVRGVSGTMDLGGSYVDKILVAYVQNKFKEKFSEDPPREVAVVERLRAACVKLKKSLTLLPNVQDQLDCFGDEFLLPISLMRADYESMISNKIETLLFTHITRALEVSGGEKKISRIVLVGGSTRIPMVAKIIENCFNGSKLDRSVNPDEAVAQGAAIYAALLGGDNSVEELAVSDMLPNSFCIAEKGSEDMIEIFRSYGCIPDKTVFSVTEKIRNKKFEVYEMVSGRRDPHRLIGTMCLLTQFQVTVHLISSIVFKIDECGIFDTLLQLGTCEDAIYTFRDVVSNYSGRLTKERLGAAMDREQQFRRDDQQEMERIEALTNLESCCFRLQNEMQTTKGKQLFPDLVAQVETAAGEAIDWLDTEGYVSKSDCHKRMKALQKLERMLQEEIRRVERLEKERTDAVEQLRCSCLKIETFLAQTDVSEEQQVADKVKEQLQLAIDWLQSETVHSKADCDNKRVALENSLKILRQGLEQRKQERERQASLNELRLYCNKLRSSELMKPLFEDDVELVNGISDQVNDTLQWLDMEDKMMSKEECSQKKNLLEEKFKSMQQRRAEREKEEDAAREKERVAAVNTLSSYSTNFRSKVCVSSMRTYNNDLLKHILEEVDKVIPWQEKGRNDRSKAECEEAMAMIKNYEETFENCVKDHELKVLREQQEKERAESQKREEKERAKVLKREEKERAEAQKREEKERAEILKREEKERAEAQKREEENRSKAKQLEKRRAEALCSFNANWKSVVSTLSMDVLEKEEPDLVNKANQSVEQTLDWLKMEGSFCPEEYKARLATLKKLCELLQKRDQQLMESNIMGNSLHEGQQNSEQFEVESNNNSSRCSLM